MVRVPRIWLEIGVIAITLVILAASAKAGEVLGARSEIGMSMANYQNQVAEEIKKYEGLLEKYPTYPPLLAHLEELYRSIGEMEMAESYRFARIKLGID